MTVRDLADGANMSTRSLDRHFIATVGTIAARTGMGTAATLRRHFNRSVGVAPGGTFLGRHTSPS